MIRLLIFGAWLGSGFPLIHVHHAPSGVEYPYECCSAMDCHMIPQEAVKEVEGGAIVRTFRGDLFFPKAKERKPIDGYWHECHRAGYGPHEPAMVPLCIFPPFKGF